jgi:FkbM family methyltransferase
MALSDEVTRARGIKRAIQKTANFFGVHVGRHPPVDSLAYHTKVLFRELGIDSVIDVGAHTGEYGLFLRELGYTGPIVSFEPSRTTFETLSKVIAADGAWTAHNEALGAQEGELEMNFYRGTVFNSFLKANSYGSERFGAATELERVEKVKVRTLEKVIDGCLAANPKANVFLKTDTQGYDLQVLAGAGPRLSVIRALQSELATRPTYEGMPAFPQALARLSEHGFELTGVFPVARDMDHLRVIEFDCVMCRPARASS